MQYIFSLQPLDRNEGGINLYNQFNTFEIEVYEVNPWEFVSGIFTLAFLLGAFYFVLIAGARDLGKRGWLLIFGTMLIGPGFLFDLIYQTYGNDSAAVLSHGLIILSGILFLISLYLSSKGTGESTQEAV